MLRPRGEAYAARPRVCMPFVDQLNPPRPSRHQFSQPRCSRRYHLVPNSSSSPHHRPADLLGKSGTAWRRKHISIFVNVEVVRINDVRVEVGCWLDNGGSLNYEGRKYFYEGPAYFARLLEQESIRGCLLVCHPCALTPPHVRFFAIRILSQPQLCTNRTQPCMDEQLYVYNALTSVDRIDEVRVE